MSRDDDDSQDTPPEKPADSKEGAASEDRDSIDSFVEEMFRLPPPEPLAPRPGERLGGLDGRRFEILRGLGQGGMGQVVRARDEVLHRIVALKFITPGWEFTGRALDKLLREEARLVAQLDHENIVRIFDVSTWKGAPFLIMECLEGQSLEALLKRGPLEPRRALRILGDITAGLAHAHLRQIIHRDLKPSNVFILPDGRAKILDFGLARFASSLGVDVERSGTPAFMAPEQWRGWTQDPRTDLWAAGVLLYLMLTGELPYPLEEGRALRERVVSEVPVPPVRTSHPELPESVERFLARALAKEPALRFQSALEMRERLRVLEWSLFPFAQAPPPRLTPHRRQVTLVCCRFSCARASLDAEDLSELQAVFHQACSRVIERYGGWVPLRLGDEVLGCFGYPLAREQDVVCAGRAALELTRLAEQLPRASELGLAVHVGVHTDLVVMEVPESSGQKALALSIQGEAPRLASWLAGQAAPHSALLSEKTWQGARGNFVTESLGWRVFYSSLGAGQVGVHRLVGESPEPTRFKRAQVRDLTPLVGRERELRQLLERWEAARKGQGVMLLLSGEAGIGKSRLIQELCEHASRAGARCVSSQCWPQLSRSAFHPVLEWLVRLIGLEPASPPGRRVARLEEVLRGLDMPVQEGLQLLGPLVNLPSGEAPPPLLSPELHRERILETLATFLLRLPALFPAGEVGPGSLLLVMEDLHWADPSTLRLLTLLRERIESAGLCLVLSTRPEPRLSWPPHPGLHPIMLERLGADETAGMIRRLTEGEPGLTAETLALLVKRTEGIPLFIEEMSRRVLSRASSGDAVSPEGSLPVTLQELCMARLDPLPQEQKELAWMGAVLGRSFTRGQLAALSERDCATLRRELEELVEAGLLLQGAEQDPRYEFRHALLQEAAYESLLKPRRRSYHQRAAWLLEHPPTGAATAPPELIAHHYTQAGELEPAIRFWTQAGELALKRSAAEESISHLEQALRLFERLPQARQRVDEKLRVLVLLGQALVASRAYSAPEVLLLYEHVARLFHDVTDPSVLMAACRGLANQNMMRLNFPLADTLAEQIVSLGQRVQVPQLRMVGRWMGAMSHFLQGDVAGARELFGEVLALAAPELEQETPVLGVLEPEPLAMAQAYQALALSLGCEEQRGQRLLDAALRRAERLDHPYTFILVSHAVCSLSQLRFEARRVLELTERQRAVYARHPYLLLESWTPVHRGWALVLLGQREEGYALMLEGLAHLRQVHAQTGWPYLLYLLADACSRLGLISEGLEAVAEGLVWSERTGQHLEDSELYRLRGELLLHQGETARALKDFQEAIQSARRSGILCIELRVTLRLYTLLREQGQRPHALRLLRELVEPLPPGLDSPELRVARELLARVQGGHAGEHELDWLMSVSPWLGGHIPRVTAPTLLEPP